MKTIISALIALSVIAGIAAPAHALDAKSFWDQQERQSGGTNAVETKVFWDQNERALP